MNEFLSFGGRLEEAEILVLKYFVAAALILLAVLVTRGPKGLKKFVDRVDAGLLILAQIMIVVLMTMLMISIFGRATFALFLELGIPRITIPDASIFSQIMMVAVVFFTIGNVQKIGGHIEVTVIANLAPPAVNLAFRVSGLLVGMIIMGAAAWFSAVRAAEDFHSTAYIYSSILYLVEWPGRTLVPIGLAWWTVRMAMQILMPSERYGDVDHIQDRLDKVG